MRFLLFSWLMIQPGAAAETEVRPEVQTEKLFLSGVEIDVAEVKRLSGLKFMDAVRFLRTEKKLRVVISGETSGDRNPEIVADGTPEADYFKSPTDLAFQNTTLRLRALYLPAGEDGPYRVSPENTDRGPRPFRDEPMIVVTSDCRINSLVHEYLHHLISTSRPFERAFEPKKGNMNEYIEHVLAAQGKRHEDAIARVKKASESGNQAEAVAAVNELVVVDTGLSLERLGWNAFYGFQELEICRFLLEHARDVNLSDDETSETYLTFTFTLDRLSKEMARDQRRLEQMNAQDSVNVMTDATYRIFSDGLTKANDFYFGKMEEAEKWKRRYEFAHPKVLRRADALKRGSETTTEPQARGMQ